ncbi:DsbC family protein [Diaphorobacter sp. J5-51]|uniref:DsbC family protein n=1 Tax=Diaphorobacter sp. J5-51 TaxID=680496 RepID=UPI000A0767FF|nr:DsbC family protein [Diaphorobacter sp. J5-51]
MFKKTLLSVSLLLGSISIACAGTGIEELEKKLTKSMPGLNVESLKETPMPGIFELVSGGDVAYVSADGVHMIQGTLFNVPERKNLSEQTLGKIRSKSVAALDANSLLVYPAKGKALHTITVFTDPSCPYCHKLHDELGKLNELGVTVKYALYARSGNGTLTGRQLQTVLCSKNPKQELDRFFKNAAQNSEGAECSKANGLEKIAKTAQQVGLQGTPHIVTDSGLSFAGYRPAEELFKVLQRGSE